MKTFPHKLFVVILLISIAACGTKADETDIKPDPIAPNTAPGTDHVAVEAILAEEVTGGITISCYEDNGYFLNKAIALFRNKYPGVTVKIDRFAPEASIKQYYDEDGELSGVIEGYDNAQTERDYIQRLNTEIMSAKGADILQIDIIPWYRYADAGYLEDLRVYMDIDPDFNKDDYRKNVLDAAMYKNGLYIFPFSFGYNFFAYDATLFNDAQISVLSSKDAFSFEELIEIVKDTFNKDAYIFGLSDGYLQSGIFHPLLRENYASFVDIENKKAYFDDGRFEELLLTVTEYAKKGYIKSAEEFKDGSWGFGRRNNPDERFYYKYEYPVSLLQNLDKEAVIGDENTRLYTPAYGYDKDDAVASVAADSNGGVLFTIANVYAINGNSKNKCAAWEFIKFLASEEAQSQTQLTGHPININAFEEQEKTWRTIGGLVPSKLNDANRGLYDKYMVLANRYADMVDTCVIQDNLIDSFIETEAAAYFAGEKSAKAAAKALQNKVKLYLNE